MLPRSLNREFAFIINDVARMLRTYADYKGAQFGVTRAQWAVLARLDRFEGLKQSELAEMLDLQPITLTRLLDRLCENGLIERAREIVMETLDASSAEEKADYGVIKEKIRTDLKRYISRQTQRRPLIMPVILEI